MDSVSSDVGSRAGRTVDDGRGALTPATDGSWCSISSTESSVLAFDFASSDVAPTPTATLDGDAGALTPAGDGS